MRYSVPRKSRRVPLSAEVHLKLEEVADPVSARSLNLSLGGMSVDYPKPPELGSLAAFEFEIGDALVEGTGEVAWVRPADPGRERPAGMGIRFRYLSPGSRERIFRLVQWYARQEGAVSAEQVATAAASGLPPPAGEARPVAGRPGLRGDASGPATESVAAAFPAPPAGEALGVQAGRGFPAPTPAARPAPSVPLPAFSGAAGAAPREAAPGPPWPASPEPATFEEREWDPEDRIEAPGPAARGVEVAEPAHTLARPQGWAYARQGRGWLVWLLLAAALFALLALAYLARDRLGGWLGAGEARGAVAEAPAGAPDPAKPAAPPGGALAEPAPPSAAPEPPPAEPAAPAAPPGQVLPRADSPLPPIEEEAAPAEVAPRPAPAPRRARVVERIRWEEAQGRTAVWIEADGVVGREAYRPVPLDGGNPRLLLRLLGIEQPYAAPQLEVGTPEVRRIRSDLKPLPGASELHVVFDLGSPRVTLAGIEETGNGLRVVLTSR